CGAGTLAAQALSKRASGGKARFIIIGGPFVDGALVGGDPFGIGLVRGLRLRRRGAVVGDCAGERGLFLAVELLEMVALFLPVASLAFLEDGEDSECEADREARDPLDVEESKKGHGWPSPSASTVAPSRVALTFRRPTGPPVSRPTITTTIAAMKPPSDQPKMRTIECSSALLQPPHMRRAIM